MTYLIDTNVVSEWMSASPATQTLDWLRNADEDTVYLSVITIGELRFGIERLQTGWKRSRLEEWLTENVMQRFEGRILPIDSHTADTWGRVAAGTTANGRPIQPADGLIAATALYHDLIVVTRNVKDFEPTGVNVMSPWTR